MNNPNIDRSGTQIEEEGANKLPENIIQAIHEKKGQLMTMRKERKKNEGLLADFATQEVDCIENN